MGPYNSPTSDGYRYNFNAVLIWLNVGTGLNHVLTECHCSAAGDTGVGGYCAFRRRVLMRDLIHVYKEDNFPFQ